MSDGPEQTTAESVHVTDEVTATEPAVPQFAAEAEAEVDAVETAAVVETPVAETAAAETATAETATAEAAAGEHTPAAGPGAEEVAEAPAAEAPAVVETPAPAVQADESAVEAVAAHNGSSWQSTAVEAESTQVETVVVETVVVETSVVEVEAVVVSAAAVETPVHEASVPEVPAHEASVPEFSVVVAPAVAAPAVEPSPAEAPAAEPLAAEPLAAEPLAAEAPAEVIVEATVVERTVSVVAEVAQAPHPAPSPATLAAVAHPHVVDTAVGISAVTVTEGGVEETVAMAVVETTIVADAASTGGPAAEPVPAVPAPTSSQWGRVTEEGVVFALGADGVEHEIGNWAAGTPAEGLAFYERKFASLKGEVDLLNKRVHGPGLAAKDAEATIAKLRESLADAHAIGDLAGLSARLDKIGRIAEQKQAARKEARAKLQAEAAVTKEALVSEAESLAESQQWKSAGERLRVLVDEWKAAPRLDRKADDELWSRFAAARGTFAKRRKAHFAQLDAQRDEVKSHKEALVEEAESLANSTDWADTAQRFRNLMQQWKTAGRAQRETEDKLWARFKTAQDTFFAARNADLDQRDAGFKENGAAKDALLAEAQKLLPVTDVKAAKTALRSIHARWETIGMVPREDKGRIEGALRDIERAVSEAEQNEWKRTNPEARARAQATVDQLRTSIGKFEKELARATEAGQAKKIADAEAAIAARQEWLAQAQAALDEFTR